MNICKHSIFNYPAKGLFLRTLFYLMVFLFSSSQIKAEGSHLSKKDINNNSYITTSDIKNVVLLVNNSLNSHTIPEDWFDSHLSPVLKPENDPTAHLKATA